MEDGVKGVVDEEEGLEGVLLVEDVVFEGEEMEVEAWERCFGAIGYALSIQRLRI